MFLWDAHPLPFPEAAGGTFLVLGLFDTLIVPLPTPSQAAPIPMDYAHKSLLCLTHIARIWRSCYRFEWKFVTNAFAGDII